MEMRGLGDLSRIVKAREVREIHFTVIAARAAWPVAAWAAVEVAQIRIPAQFGDQVQITLSHSLDVFLFSVEAIRSQIFHRCGQQRAMLQQLV